MLWPIADLKIDESDEENLPWQTPSEKEEKSNLVGATPDSNRSPSTPFRMPNEAHTRALLALAGLGSDETNRLQRLFTQPEESDIEQKATTENGPQSNLVRDNLF